MKRKIKEFRNKYDGQDKIIGRPIRLNQVELEPIPGKDYAELLFWGDVHLGHPQTNIKKAISYLEYAKQRGAYVLLMGDLLESGLRLSVGDSVYRQKLNPQEQMERMVEILTPYTDLIIGLHSGNHEDRITQQTGIDVSKIMARFLGVKYLKYSCWHLLKVGKQKYSMYSTHGSGNSKYKHTKMKKAMDLAHWIDADIIAYGHQHSIGVEPIIKQSVDFRNRQVKETECWVILTGSYIRWEDSYAQKKDFPITRLGSPKIKLSLAKKDIHTSI